VVDGALALRHGGVHEAGILNPNDATFHVKLIRGLKYDLAVCSDCHGEDFKGGGAKVSCTACHEGGPTACTTCHAQPPTTGPYAGAHLAHAAGAGLDKPLGCSACHKVPAVWNEAGHLLDGNGNPKTRATVSFGQVAALPTLKRVNPPTYNPATLTCSSVYCHGGAFDDAKATHKAPVWTEGAAGAACGSCHGSPPANHGDNAQDCAECHAQVVGPGKALLRPASLHVDGQVQVKDGTVRVADGTGTVSCTACHGQPPATGAHLAHLYPSRFTTGPVACSACHTVPQKVGSDGHLHAAPGRLAFSGTATANVVTSPFPAWDASAGTCRNVYCHGGGDKAVRDSTPLLHRHPLWAGGAAEAECGSCHGLPPNDPAHVTSTPGGAITGIQDCYKCHYDTIRPDGGFKDPGLHVNGDPNVKKVPNAP
jgi:predicted CxxxxCH...CXXCH cytochrome family protein